jgi:hypothetical protein
VTLAFEREGLEHAFAEPGVEAHGLRERSAILAVAVVAGGVGTATAEAGALTPEGERLDAVARADEPVVGMGPAFEPTPARSGLDEATSDELTIGLAGVGGAVVITAAAFATRRRLRSA